MQCIVIIVLKIELAGQVRYNKQQLNSQRRPKHVRNTIEMKSYPSLNSDTGCSNGWSSICDLFVAWALDVRDLLLLHSYIGRTPFSYPCVLCKKVRPIRVKIQYIKLSSVFYLQSLVRQVEEGESILATRLPIITTDVRISAPYATQLNRSICFKLELIATPFTTCMF